MNDGCDAQARERTAGRPSAHDMLARCVAPDAGRSLSRLHLQDPTTVAPALLEVVGPGGSTMLTGLPRLRHGHRIPTLLRLADDAALPESRLDRVRGAGAAFLRGTTVGWSRRDLADWLMCQYAPCATNPRHLEGEELPPAAERTLDEGIIERVILDARARVLRLLGELVVPWQASPIARLSIASGTVAAERDERGGVAFSPVNVKRVRLAERVASLFVADYLNRPNEYRWLMLCRECGELAFTSELAHADWCEAPPESWTAFTAADAITLAAGV